MVKSEFGGWPILQESQHNDKIIENKNFCIDLLIKLHLHHLNPFFAIRPINIELVYDVDNKNIFANGHCEEFFEDAKAFKPERFMKADSDNMYL